MGLSVALVMALREVDGAGRVGMVMVALECRVNLDVVF